MFTIKKYPIEKHTFVDMPENSIVLCAEESEEEIVVYAVINEDEKKIHRREFFVYDTDEKIEKINGLKFIGTIRIKTITEKVGAGAFTVEMKHAIPDRIYHVFEKISIEEMLKKGYGTVVMEIGASNKHK